MSLFLSLTGLDASQQHFKSLKPILLYRFVSSSNTSKYRCNCDSVSSEFSDLNVSASWLSHFLFFLSWSLSSNVFTCFLDSMIIFSSLKQKIEANRLLQLNWLLYLHKDKKNHFTICFSWTHLLK